MEFVELIDEFNDYNFDYGVSIKMSKEIINYINQNNKKNINFDSDHWPVFLVLKKRFTHFRFIKIRTFCDKYNKSILGTDNQIVIFKCWCASLLEKFEPLTVKNYMDCFKGFVEATEGLKHLSYDKVLPNTNNMAKNVKNYLSVVILNLLDFYPEFFGELDEKIYVLLENLKSLVNKRNSVKKIPGTYDFLVLDKVINDYFSRKLTKDELLKWSSIKFWWKITTVIPLRISEFCLINKDNLIENEDGAYLEVKRVKISSKNKERHIDLIKIPKNYFMDLKNYINLQNEVDSVSETIFSRKVIRDYIYDDHKKLLFPDFTALFFRKLLSMFYTEIVCGLYGYKEYEVKSKQVFPNDTRHLAFINLKLQGFRPVEVARIGGHVNLNTQEHYFSHVTNMMDLELLSIFSRYRLEEYNYISKEFINKYVLKPVKSEYKIKLDLGYCTDPDMKCRVEECIECEHWRITSDELNSKREIILFKMKKTEDSLKASLDSISKLYNDLVNSMTQTESLKSVAYEKEVLSNKSNEVFKQLNRYLNLDDIQRRINKSEKKL